jgi:hypothetical protein
MLPCYMIPSHSSQLLCPSPRFSPPCALSVSAFSSLASPFDFELPTVNSLSLRSAHQYHSTALTHPLFSYSCALFCHNENDNLFAFRRLHTLCPKHPGWGPAIVNFFVAQISDLPVLPATSNKSPVPTSALFLSPVTSHQSQIRDYVLDSTSSFCYPFFVLDAFSISAMWRFRILCPFAVNKCFMASSVVMSLGCFASFFFFVMEVSSVL